MMRPLALFRADASKQTGAGHALRCLALAQAWSDLGGSSVFAMGESAELVDRSLAEEGIEVRRLDDHGPLALSELASREKAAWIVLDGYQFDATFEQTLRLVSPGLSLLSIDDKIRDTSADIFVLPSSCTPPSCLRPAPAKVFAGWKYALLRRDFRAQPPSDHPIHGRVLVMLGGTDATDKAAEIASVLACPAADHGWDVQVVSRADLPAPVSRVEPRSDIGPLIAVADAGVATASTVALEFCARGVPAVLLVVAKNQKATAEALVAAGVALVAESVGEIESGLLEVMARRKNMSEAASKLVDGKGGERVATAMMCWSPRLRAVVRGDADLLLAWANDPETRANSFNRETIKPEEHRAWLEGRLADGCCWMRLAEDATGRCFGTVRIEGDEEPTVSITLAPTHRGLGLGEKLLSLACAAYPHEGRGTLRAEVRPDNAASRMIFEANGFRLIIKQPDRLIFGKTLV